LPSDFFRRRGVIFDLVFVVVCLKRHVWVKGSEMQENWNKEEYCLLGCDFVGSGTEEFVTAIFVTLNILF